MSSDVAISTEHLTKVFRVPLDRGSSFRDLAFRGFRSAGYRRFDALHDVNLEIKRGEFFSVIGPNGSGKSTLLKIMAGIYRPTSGRVAVSGRLSPFIELGVGFNAELTARENIYLSGAILGLSRTQVEQSFDEMVRFSELSEFIDQKLKNYSSGMLVRLAFAVAIQAHADILLVDEVLAVGDASFQEKCFDVFRTFKAEGRTIVFVSHDMASVQEFSDRVLLLHRGEPRGVFTPARAAVEYSRLIDEHANMLLSADGHASTTQKRDEPHIVSVEMLDASGNATHSVRRDEVVTVKIRIRNPDSRPVDVGVAIYRNDGLYCFGANTVEGRTTVPTEREVSLLVEFAHLNLQHGSYWLTVGLFSPRPSRVYEMLEKVYSFHVGQGAGFDGAFYMEHRWRVGERA